MIKLSGCLNSLGPVRIYFSRMGIKDYTSEHSKQAISVYYLIYLKELTKRGKINSAQETKTNMGNSKRDREKAANIMDDWLNDYENEVSGIDESSLKILRKFTKWAKENKVKTIYDSMKSKIKNYGK